MAGNDSNKAQGDTASGGKKSGTASAGRTEKVGREKPADGAGKKGSSQAGRGKRVAAAAVVVVAGGAAVAVVKRRRRRKADADAEAERGAAGARSVRGSQRELSSGGERKRRTAGGGLAQPVRPDAALAAVVGGSEPRTRAEITKRVWDYIKSNSLQDAQNRRSIRADDRLRPVFGKDQITMFELPRAINAHIEKM